ncbi:hypothetical protein KAU34_01090 [candidate division WOR-3 bacterium]|nr:hypothetical protein [candidate division WOR-3 bacterium]
MNLFSSRKKTRQELIKDLTTHLGFLNDFINEYDQGKEDYYQKIAAELRILLCDTKIQKDKKGKTYRVDNSLFPRLFPELRLHPISFQPDPEEFKKRGQELICFIPGTISFKNGNFGYHDIFDLSGEPMSINSWLEQSIDIFITIKQLIKSVANKNGGAHVDNDLNETLIRTSHFFIGDKARAVFIVEIGRYVLSEISEKLANIEQTGA